VLSCRQGRFDDAVYLIAFQCGRSFVVCKSGSVVYAHVCPTGTRFHVGRLTCLIEEVCRTEQRPVDRDPRQIKYLLADDDFGNAGWNSHRVARRQIKFRSLSALDSDSSSYDDDPEGLVRRQIKFRSLPEVAVVDGGRRPARQIKFRSLAERAIEPKKHAESRQVKFDALNNPGDLVAYTADVNNQYQLPSYWYRRR